MIISEAIEQAGQEALKSDDPSTKVGTLLFAPSGIDLIGRGHNHLVGGTSEEHWVDGKHLYVVHSEVAAILDAARKGYSTEGSIMVSSWAACNECAVVMVEAGVAELVRKHVTPPERWADSIALGDEILTAGGVRIIDVN